MDVETLGNWSIMAGVKLALLSTSPIQRFFDKPGITHVFCNHQALKILKNEGNSTCADFFSIYRKQFISGTIWADKDWKNISHFFIPGSGKGLFKFDNAVTEFKQFINSAFTCARQRDYAAGVFFIGAAAHLVQDMCVPHHARGKLFAGHQEYECWAQKHYRNYAVNDFAAMNQSFNPEQWLINNAVIAADFFDLVNQQATQYSYHQATRILLPRAQQSTAAFLQQIYTLLVRQTDLLSDINKIIVA